MKILVPLDGSRTAEHSLVYLDALKKLGDAHVRLLGVADDAEEFHGRNSAEAREREANLLSTYLREVTKDIEAHAGIEVEAKIVSGPPALRIVEEAGDFSPDILVISTHGRSGAARWRLGSVADKVIRGAMCSTLVVGPNAHDDEIWLDAGAELPFKSILVPLDGSAMADEALCVANRFAECFDSTIHIVRAVAMSPFATGLAGEGAYMPGLIDCLVEGATEHVQKVAAELSPKVRSTTDVLLGDPALQLEEYVQQRGIDLVVMTTHGRGGFSRTALGSVTDRMLAEAKAPVLIVRSGRQ